MANRSQRISYGAGKGTAEFDVPESESDKVRQALMDAMPASFTAKPARASPELRRAWESLVRSATARVAGTPSSAPL